jgi:hypothetical protein
MQADQAGSPLRVRLQKCVPPLPARGLLLQATATLSQLFP